MSGDGIAGVAGPGWRRRLVETSTRRPRRTLLLPHQLEPYFDSTRPVPGAPIPTATMIELQEETDSAKLGCGESDVIGGTVPHRGDD